MEFTEKILEIIQSRNLTAYKICKDLEISQSTFTAWKKGSIPSVEQAIKIIKYLQLSADELFNIEVKTQSELTKDEKEILDYFRQLPADRQQRELGRMEGIAGEYAAKSAESESTTYKTG